MDLSNSSLQISLNSTLESVDVPALVVKQQLHEKRPEQPSNDDRDCLIEKIMELYLKHNVTLECLTDWVKLLNTRLEDCEKLPQGKVQLLNLFRQNCDLLDIFFFVKCNKCQKSTKAQPDQTKGLKCSHCHALLKTNETNFFVILPIEKQIIQSIEYNWAEISKFDTSDKNAHSYSDAHDGAILRSVLKEYEDLDVNILSLCLNVDGANKFKSNSLSVWPIQLTQNYLPPHIRFLPQNIILNGLYYHKSSDEAELSFHEYMLPLINELNQLKQDFISINIEAEQFKFKPVITHCAVDLPAKSKIQETKQFGGYFACTYCEIPGEIVHIEKSKTKPNKKSQNKLSPKATAEADMAESETKTNKFVRYLEGDGPYKLRDEVETLEKMLSASRHNGKQSIDGIKDVSCLVGLEHFNIVWSVGVEYLHCCLQGVEKRLLNHFLSPKNSNKDYYIVPPKRKMLDQKLLKLKPTSSIVRKPRSLIQRSNFKASEFRSMLLYFLPVCLPGSVRYVYVKQHRLLSAAVYILLKKTISSEEVDGAEQMLHLFVEHYQELFGKENMVMVVHLLKHLAQSVRQLGPLWCHSAFPFERNNGCLLKLANGTTDVLHQISSKYCLAKSMNRRADHDDTNMDAKMLLGKGEDMKVTESRIFDVTSVEILNFENMLLTVYKRIKLRKIIYTSRLYTRPKRSIDYFIELKNGAVGMAKYYFPYQGNVCVMMDEFEIIDNVDHIYKVTSANRLIIAPIDEIEKNICS